MPNIKEIVERMNSVSSMRQITKTMQLIAASKFNRAQQNLIRIKNYEKYLNDIRDKVLTDIENEAIKNYRCREKKDNLLLVVFSADKGFCGSFNSSVIKKTGELFNSSGGDFKKVEILPVGKKAFSFFKKNGFPIVGEFGDVIAKFKIENVYAFAEWLIGEFLEGKYDKILVVYNSFKNASSRELSVGQFLPMIVEVQDEKPYPDEYLFEPSKSEILKSFIPFKLKTDLTHLIFESNASEQAARMINMTKATDNAEALIKSLRMLYNQSRQTMITNEIIEISAGADAIK
ncbi:MAG: ATP synthase F1 subunit gamma [Cytophagales bacterium]|jgi:F-type H+-transporting ATPase subunit gamma|nr:ATP synthase F1 subunit gamma [Cytophagales bacterium]